jgi:hypothetical protein
MAIFTAIVLACATLAATKDPPPVAPTCVIFARSDSSPYVVVRISANF